MADILIYTANFGHYDTVLTQCAQDVDVDWLCLTDDVDFQAPEPWLTLPVRPSHPHPNLAAKVFKAQPPWSLGDWHTAIWIDANMEIMEPSFVREAMQYLHDGMATWDHPRRDCVYDEVAVCLPGTGKERQDDRYVNLPLQAQADAYRAEGYPEHYGLFASGTMVWTEPASSTVGKAWLAECEEWGFQDQVALPVVCWRMGIQPGVFGVQQIERRYSPRVTWRQRARGDAFYLANRWLRIWPHARPATP